MKKLGVFLVLMATYIDFESRWMLFCEYINNPDAMFERFEMEKRLEINA